MLAAVFAAVLGGATILTVRRHRHRRAHQAMLLIFAATAMMLCIDPATTPLTLRQAIIGTTVLPGLFGVTLGRVLLASVLRPSAPHPIRRPLRRRVGSATNLLAIACATLASVGVLTR